MEKPAFLEQLESRLLLVATPSIGVTAFTVTPDVITPFSGGPTAMTVTLHNYGTADLAGQNVAMYLYLYRQGARYGIVGGVTGNLTIPAGQDFVYHVPEDDLSNLDLANNAPDEYGLEVLIDANANTDDAHKDLVSGSMVIDDLGNSHDDAVNEGILAAGQTQFTDAVGPLDSSDYGFFYFPGGSLDLRLAAVSNEVHVSLTNYEGAVVFGQDTSGMIAGMDSLQSLPAGYYYFAITAKNNLLTRYTLTLDATPVNVGLDSVSVNAPLVTRGGGEIILTTQYTVDNGSPQSLQIYSYLSTDKTWDQNDKQFFGKYYTDDDVLVGTHNLVIDAQAPVDYPLGSYYVITKITCVGDSNAADNEVVTANTAVTVFAGATFTLGAGGLTSKVIMQDNHVFTLTYSGAGSADVFCPSNAENFGVSIIEIHGSDATSTLSVTTKSRGARLDITKIEGDGALKGLSLGCVNIAHDGAVTIAGLVKTLTLGNLAYFARVTVGGGPTDTMKATLDAVSNGSLISTASISSLKATDWVGAGYNVLQAPSVGSLTVTGRKAKKGVDALEGDFDADMTLNAGAVLANTTKVLGSVKIAGSAQDSTWDITGYAGGITIGRMLGGTSNKSEIKVTGDIASITAGKAAYLDVLVGTFVLPNWDDRHPADLAAVTTHQKLGSFKINGLKGSPADTKFFDDVCISAYEVGTVTLKGAQLPAAVGDFGLFAGKIKSMNAVALDRHTYSWPPKRGGIDNSGGLFNLLA